MKARSIKSEQQLLTKFIESTWCKGTIGNGFAEILKLSQPEYRLHYEYVISVKDFLFVRAYEMKKLRDIQAAASVSKSVSSVDLYAIPVG